MTVALRVPALLLLLGGAAHAEPPGPPAAPAAAIPELPVEIIQETTVGTLGGVDVGVANMWEREYTDGAGRTRTGLTARLDVDVDGTTQRLFVGEGSVVEIGGHKWEIVALVKPANGNGQVSLRAAP